MLLTVQTLAPNLLVDDCDTRAAGPVFTVGKGAADERIEIEKPEVVCRDERAAHTIGSFATGHVHALTLKCGQVVQRMHLRLEVLSFGNRKAVAIATGSNR